MNRQELITVLYEYGFGDIEPMNNWTGICNQILDGIDPNLEVEANRLFKVWPEFSGNITYPVPSICEGRSAMETYHNRHEIWAGEYGAARRRLCVFLADQLSLNQ